VKLVKIQHFFHRDETATYIRNNITVILKAFIIILIHSANFFNWMLQSSVL